VTLAEETHRLSDPLCRDTTLSLPELEKRGQVYFQANYGETADDVQELLDRIYPDMGEHTMLLEYAIRF
jgi:hypothetical protein